MLNILSDLHNGAPSVGSKLFFTGVALHPSLNKLYYEGLLHIGSLSDIFGDGQFYFDSLWMWLCPYEAGINELNSIQSFDFTQT